MPADVADALFLPPVPPAALIDAPLHEIEELPPVPPVVAGESQVRVPPTPPPPTVTVRVVPHAIAKPEL
jgi:hypothetical protein